MTERFFFFFKSDLGVFEPYGLQFTLPQNSSAYNIMTQIMAFGPPNATRVVGGGGGEDSGPWICKEIFFVSLLPLTEEKK